MKDYLKMIFVLTGIAVVCGFLLAAVKMGTAKRIEEQILVHVKGPALEDVLATSDNDLIKDRREIEIEDESFTVFIGKKNNKPWAVAFESKGTGFGGDISIVVGFDLQKDALTGIGILTHKETPGLGARIVEESFRKNFKGREITGTFKIKKDDGDIDAVTGASYSSRGVCLAVNAAIALYPPVKDMAVGK